MMKSHLTTVGFLSLMIYQNSMRTLLVEYRALQPMDRTVAVLEHLHIAPPTLIGRGLDRKAKVGARSSPSRPCETSTFNS